MIGSSEIEWARRTAWALLTFYGLGVLGIMLVAGEPWTVTDLLAVVPFFVWAIAPLSVASIFAHRTVHPAMAMIVVGMMAIAAVSGLYIYLTAMFGPDSRSTAPLIFLFLPLYQWAVPLVLLCAAGAFAVTNRLAKHD